MKCIYDKSNNSNCLSTNCKIFSICVNNEFTKELRIFEKINELDPNIDPDIKQELIQEIIEEEEELK